MEGAGLEESRAGTQLLQEDLAEICLVSLGFSTFQAGSSSPAEGMDFAASIRMVEDDKFEI